MHQSLCSVYIKSAYLPLHSPRGSVIIPVIQTEKWRPPQRKGEKNIPATENWGTLWLIQHILSVYSTQGPFLKKISLLPQSWVLSARSVQLPERRGGWGCRNGKWGWRMWETSALGLPGTSSHPRPLPSPPSSWPYPHLRDPGKCSFSSLSLERITKVFSLALLSCDQSIAQETGSLKSCLSKISDFTRWRAHSASYLPRANISVTCVLRARLRPHILCSGKENMALLSEHFPLCSCSRPPPPAPQHDSEARRKS